LHRSGTVTRPGWSFVASPPRGVSVGFCDHHTGCVFSDPGDADRARIPRRRLRVSLQGCRPLRLLAPLFSGGLGAGWLVIKTEGALPDWARRQGRLCLIGVVVGIVIVSLWTPLMEQRIAERCSRRQILYFFGRCRSPHCWSSSGHGERFQRGRMPRPLSLRSCCFCWPISVS